MLIITDKGIEQAKLQSCLLCDRANLKSEQSLHIYQRDHKYVALKIRMRECLIYQISNALALNLNFIRKHLITSVLFCVCKLYVAVEQAESSEIILLKKNKFNNFFNIFFSWFQLNESEFSSVVFEVLALNVAGRHGTVNRE